MTLSVAINYGGRAEIVDAARSLAREALGGRLALDAIDDEMFARHLYAGGGPDVDLLIRTAGEMRISNFLLWQAWYAELYVTDVLWPDFDSTELRAALSDYARRIRKFGAVSPCEASHTR